MAALLNRSSGFKVRSLVGAAAGFAVLAMTTGTASASVLPGYFNGGATAARGDASLGVLSLVLQRLAAEGCPCQGTNGKTQTATVGPASVPGLLTVDATTATSYAKRTSTKAENQDSATIAGLSLLGGLITADGITAEATIRATDSELTTSPSGSGFTNLVIAGQKIDPAVKHNTVVPLPGIGNVTVYGVTKSGKANSSATLTVTMLTVAVTETNTLSLPVGASISIGVATAGYTRAQPKVGVSGMGAVADVNLAAGDVLLADLGSLGDTSINACTGTNGKTVSKTVAAVDGGGLVTLAGGTTTAFGGPTDNKTTIAQTTSTVSGVSLLGGLITAGTLTAEATETAVNKVVTASAAGSSFGNLVIAGVPVPLNVPPNTIIPLPLVGQVIVNEQEVPANGNGPTVVNGLHITVTAPNTLGAPVGTDIVLAHVNATAVPLAK